MKYFVIHHPPLVERRQKLEKQFEERGILEDDVEWVTVCSPEEAELIKERTGVPLPVKYISMSMKHYTVFKKMVDEDIPHAIVFEDDTIFTEYFDIEKIPLTLPYVKLCRPVGDSYCTDNGSPFVCRNNGCTDAYYLTKEFAEVSLKNIQMIKPIDIEIHNTLVKFYNSRDGCFLCIPMCYQLGPGPCEFTDGEDWISYVNNKSHPVFEYEKLICLQ